MKKVGKEVGFKGVCVNNWHFRNASNSLTAKIKTMVLPSTLLGKTIKKFKRN